MNTLSYIPTDSSSTTPFPNEVSPDTTRMNWSLWDLVTPYLHWWLPPSTQLLLLSSLNHPGDWIVLSYLPSLPCMDLSCWIHSSNSINRIWHRSQQNSWNQVGAGQFAMQTLSMRSFHYLFAWSVFSRNSSLKDKFRWKIHIFELSTLRESLDLTPSGAQTSTFPLTICTRPSLSLLWGAPFWLFILWHSSRNCFLKQAWNTEQLLPSFLHRGQKEEQSPNL